MRGSALKTIVAVLLVAALSFSGCRTSSPPPPQSDARSPRIVSFSPALTDILYDMGLGDHVVGVTSYCLPPPGSDPPVVGDRTRVSAEAILAVRPDVVLIQQNPDDFGALKTIAPNIRIEHVRIETLADIAATIERIGKITAAEQLGKVYREDFDRRCEAVRLRVSGLNRPKVLFVFGYERPGTSGKGTFLDEMIQLAGGVNAPTAHGYTRYPTLNRENILAMEPDVLICQVASGSEQKAIEYFQTFRDLPAIKNDRLFVVTDRRWTIPSMRSAEFAEKLAEMIHPSVREARSD